MSKITTVLNQETLDKIDDILAKACENDIDITVNISVRNISEISLACSPSDIEIGEDKLLINYNILEYSIKNIKSSKVIIIESDCETVIILRNSKYFCEIILLD